MKPRLITTTLAAAATLLLTQSAWAHPGHNVNGFLGGAAHPLSGIDHLCAMIAVGLWAAQLGKRAIFIVPITFVALMALGGLLGFVGAPLPFVESGIAASVLILGLLVATGLRLRIFAAATLVGVFALFHGFAHGAEIPQDMTRLTYAGGFILSTAGLLGIGLALGLLLSRIQKGAWVRLAGSAVAVCGGLLLIGAL